MYDINKIVVFDTESSGLLKEADKVHCLVTCDSREPGIQQWHNSPLLPRQGTLQEGLDYLDTFDYICGHNIIGHDLPLLRKLGYKPPKRQILDTFILSQLLFPNEIMTHGLGEWGKRFGILKPKQEQWQVFNEEMLHRCTEDTKINFKLLQECLKEMNSDYINWSKTINFEQNVYQTYIEHGLEWYIDKELLDEKLQQYIELHEKIENQLKALRGIKAIPGDMIYKNTVCKVEFQPFNPSSNKQLIEFLLGKGWKPEKFTPKDAPSLRDDPLKGVPKNIADVISDFKDAIHRKGVLKGFKEKMKEDGSIEMFAFTSGTNTSRFTHRIVANIQEEFKPLFICKPGYKLVGADASQLEARIEGHYVWPYDNGVYANYLLNMDVHQFNADSWGIERSEAKAPFYALSYGCGAKKISSMLNISQERGKEIIETHYDTFPGLKIFIAQIEKALDERGFLKKGKFNKMDLDESKRPWVRAIDGRKLYVRGMHKLKNTLIQSAGSICMKHAYLEIAREIKKHSLDAKIVMFYHDSFDVMCKDDENQIKLLTSIIENAIINSGTQFKLRIPLNGKVKVGNNWGDTK